MKKALFIAILLGLLAGPVYAAPPYTVSKTILPEITNLYELGTTTRQWLNIFSQNASTTNLLVQNVGATNATTTFLGNVRVNGILQVIDRIIATSLYVVDEVFYNGLTGPNFTATSTSIASILPYASTTAVSFTSACFGSDCRTSWPNGIGNVATSSSETATRIPFWTSTNGTPATLSGGNSTFTWDNTLNKISFPYASTTAITSSGSAYFAQSSGQVGIATGTAVTSKVEIGGTQVSNGGSGFGRFLQFSGLMDFNSSADSGTIINVTPSVTNASASTLNSFRAVNVDIGTVTATGNLLRDYAAFSAADESVATSSIGYLYGTHPQGTVDFAAYFNTSDNVYLGTGNVGISTSTPQADLVLGNTIAFETTSAGASAPIRAALGGINLGFGLLTSGPYIQSYASQPLILNSGGNNVGIGTTSPDYLLTLGDVASAANNKIAIDAAAARQSSIAFRSDGINRWFVGRGDSDVLPVTTFFIGNTSGGTNNDPGGSSAKLVINSTGDVGIATSSPYAKLSVAGTIVGASFVGTTTATSTFGGGLDIGSGCYAVGGSCFAGPTQFVSTSDGVKNITGNIISVADFVALGGDYSKSTSTTLTLSGSIFTGGVGTDGRNGGTGYYSSGGDTTSGSGTRNGGNAGDSYISEGGISNGATGVGGEAGDVYLARGGEGSGSPTDAGNDGIVRIGRDSATGRANVGVFVYGNATTTGTVYWSGLQLNTGAATASLCLDSNNQMKRNTDAETCIASSERYKENISKLSNLTADLLSLEPVSFRYKENDKLTHYGLIAEQVEKIDPTLISYDDNGEPNGIRWSHIVTLLIQGHQDQEARITALENKQGVGYWPLLGLLGLLGLLPRKRL